ncbi:MAG: HAD-IIIA family hydrolase [Thermodesulfobacteriota bacterium]|nr:HAD-IIIA family hydrolase [Thermodesulfobacteriota bacterium]
MKKIKALILDADGVLTDSRIYITDTGMEIKAFNAKDGHGIKMIMRAGIHVAIITGRKSKALQYRAKELGIKHVIENSKDKKKALKKIAAKLGIDTSEIAYMGDDLVDLPAMAICGLTIAPSDAVDMVRKKVNIVTDNPGGRGSVRQAIEYILKSQDLYDKIMEHYVV